MSRNRLHQIAQVGGVLNAVLFATSAHAAINISTQATQNMSCSGGVCTATAQKAYLNVNDVTNFLAAGDLKVVSGAGAEDIHIQTPFSWTSTSRLTLDAQRSIEFEKPVSVAGTGALTLITNDGGTGGDYWFDEGASVSFWDTSSSLIINGQSFTLVKDIKTLASDIAANPSGNFALANSYDASLDGTYKHAPVIKTFAGSFEGLGNTFANLGIRKDTANKDLNVGLFAKLSSGGNVRDLRLDHPVVFSFAVGGNIGALIGDNDGGLVANVYTTGGGGAFSPQAADVGGLVGRNESHALIRNSGASSFGGGGGVIGGLVGYNSAGSTIAFAFANGGVDGYAEGTSPAAGGLVGQNDGTIDHSSSTNDLGFTGSCAGGLAGSSSGTISHSYATGNINPEGEAGGLVCQSSGTISHSHATGSVLSGAPGPVGGLVGDSQGTIDHSYATGAIQGGDSSLAGGLAGNSQNSISYCYATGAVTAGNSANAGGLVGIAHGTIDQSFATGATSVGDNSSAGALVGWLQDDGGVAHSYSEGAARVGDHAEGGGLVGRKDRYAAIAQAYSTGVVTGGDRASVGGLLGYDGATHHAKNSISSSYWDLSASGISDPSQGAGNVANDGGITGLTDAQLKSGLPDTFDPQVWRQSPSINNGYPYLLANPPPKENKAAKRSGAVHAH